MRRVGSPNTGLVRTSPDRASITDLNKLREKDFVSGYLDRLTTTVKIKPSDVLRAESLLDPSTYLSVKQSFVTKRASNDEGIRDPTSLRGSVNMLSYDSVQALIKNIVAKSPSKQKTKLFKDLNHDKSGFSKYGGAMRNDSTRHSPNARLNESSSLALLD